MTLAPVTAHSHRLSMFWVMLPLLGTLITNSATADTDEPTAVQSVFPEPGMSDARLRIATGRAVNNAPEIFSEPLDMPGPISAWGIGQWHRESVITPRSLRIRPGRPTDPIFGDPLYLMSASDGNSRVTVYRNGQHGSLVYDLYGKDGGLVDAGGANLFLGASSYPTENRMDAPMRYSLKARISAAEAVYLDPGAARTGAVLAQVFSGFVLHHDPVSGNGGNATMFLQIPIARSGTGSPEYASCSRSAQGNLVVTSDHLLAGERMLPFVALTHPLTKLDYDLNAHAKAVLTQQLRCRVPSGTTIPLRLADMYGGLAGWTVTSMYVGLETENRDLRHGSHTVTPRGSVTAGLEISDLRVTRNTTSSDR